MGFRLEQGFTQASCSVYLACCNRREPLRVLDSGRKLLDAAPVGYAIRGGRAELVDFLAVITQPFAILTYLHVTFAGYIVAGFFVMGVSAYHLLRKSNVSFFSKSFRIALIFSLIFSIGEVIVGDFHGKIMGKTQPAKLAAVESQWETAKGVPFSMLLIPDEANERNSVEMFQIPKFMSWLVYDHWDAEIKGLKEWPKEDRPPVTLTFWSFRIMVGLGFLFALLTVIGWFKRNRLETDRWYLRIMMYAIPLPYLAAELGWMVTEVGRQPWIVYDVMRTSGRGFSDCRRPGGHIAGGFCSALFTAWA